MFKSSILGFSTVILAILPVQAESLNSLTISDVPEKKDLEKVNWPMPSNHPNTVEILAKDTKTTADIFSPYLTQISDSLPSYLLMRLPSEIAVKEFLGADQSNYTLKIYSSLVQPSLTVNIYDCAEPSLSCKVGSFSVHTKTSVTIQETFKQFQEKGIPLSLISKKQGYLLEEKKYSTTLSTLIWEQDSGIYIINLRNKTKETLTKIANSMIQSIPIQPTLIGAKSSSIAQKQSPIVEGELEDKNLWRELPLDWKKEAQSSLFESNLIESISPNLEKIPQIADVPESEETQEFIPILPEELEIDESGGDFPIGIIRKIPPMELEIGSSVLTTGSFTGSLPVRDTVFSNGIALKGQPAIGPTTRLASGIGGGFVRFSGGGGYDSLATNLGVLQELDTNMSLGLGWRYRHLYNQRNDANDRNLSEHSVILSWSREDQLSKNLFLFSGYQFQANIANDGEQSRITNSLGINFAYSFTSELIGLIGYQFITDDFTEQDLTRTRSQVGGQLVYQVTDTVSIGGSVSYLFGDFYDLLRSGSTANKRVDNVSVGFHVGLNVPFFF